MHKFRVVSSSRLRPRAPVGAVAFLVLVIRGHPSVFVRPYVKRLHVFMAVLAVAIPDATARSDSGFDPLLIPRAPLILIATAQSPSETPEDEETARRRRADKEIQRGTCFHAVLALVGACGLLVAWIRGKPLRPFRR